MDYEDDKEKEQVDEETDSGDVPLDRSDSLESSSEPSVSISPSIASYPTPESNPSSSQEQQGTPILPPSFSVSDTPFTDNVVSNYPMECMGSVSASVPSLSSKSSMTLPQMSSSQERSSLDDIRPISEQSEDEEEWACLNMIRMPSYVFLTYLFAFVIVLVWIYHLLNKGTKPEGGGGGTEDPPDPPTSPPPSSFNISAINSSTTNATD